MKISYVYENIKKAMNYIENVDIFGATTRTEKKVNQEKINKAYNILNNIKNEIVIENQISKRKEENKDE